MTNKNITEILSDAKIDFVISCFYPENSNLPLYRAVIMAKNGVFSSIQNNIDDALKGAYSNLLNGEV